MLIANCSLLIADRLLLIAHRSSLIADRWSLISDCWLLIAVRCSLIADYLLLITCYLLLIIIFLKNFTNSNVSTSSENFFVSSGRFHSSWLLSSEKDTCFRKDRKKKNEILYFLRSPHLTLLDFFFMKDLQFGSGNYKNVIHRAV